MQNNEYALLLFGELNMMALDDLGYNKTNKKVRKKFNLVVSLNITIGSFTFKS